ncbi:MAG TPA: hypothetical protein VLC12_14115, partial [Terriglobales bacterium]|nr:hypothetical protein [Terriglobales bacterium]
MKAPVDEFASIVDRLATRLEELERRVAALEHPSPPHPQATAALSAAVTPQGHPLAQIGRSFNGMPVIGKVFLGLAGAYLLRALAESGSIPKWPVACVALVYAGLWLLWAARTASKVAFASAAYATTAAVILLPMLWELTLRFNVMPARFTAAVLVVFVAAASGLAWKSRASAVVWSPAAFASVAAVVLLLGTHDPFPFTLALLLMALMTEAAASTGRWLSLRPWVAVPADLAVLAMIVLYTGRDGLSPEYKPVASEDLLALSAGLFVIYAASVLSRTLALRRKISVFEIGQTVAAFLLASFGVLRTTHHAAAPGLGVFCLLAAAACYWLAFARFENTDLRRNQHVFSTWAIALALAGSLLCFSVNANALWLGLAAIMATFAGVRSARFSLALHGALYLVAMALVSGLLLYGGALLAGEPPRPGGWTVWASCLFIAGCYALAWRGLGQAEPQWSQKMLWLSFA